MMLQGWNQLNNVFNYAMPTSQAMAKTGAATTGTGLDTLGGAGAYWQRLLTGSRPALEAAVAPERNMMLSSADAARRQQAQEGTARGGGTAGANQQQQEQVQSQIDQALLGVRPAAAKETAQIGAQEAGIGLETTAQAQNLLGLGAQAASNVGAQTEADYQGRAQQQASLFGDITSGLALGLGLAYG
jgi:hypothetical protein